MNIIESTYAVNILVSEKSAYNGSDLGERDMVGPVITKGLIIANLIPIYVITNNATIIIASAVLNFLLEDKKKLNVNFSFSNISDQFAIRWRNLSANLFITLIISYLL